MITEITEMIEIREITQLEKPSSIKIHGRIQEDMAMEMTPTIVIHRMLAWQANAQLILHYLNLVRSSLPSTVISITSSIDALKHHHHYDRKKKSYHSGCSRMMFKRKSDLDLLPTGPSESIEMANGNCIFSHGSGFTNKYGRALYVPDHLY